MLRIIFAPILLMVPVVTLADVTELPAQLVLNVEGLSKEDISIGQQYASCMSAPWLPTADQFETKAKTCANFRASRSSKLKGVMRWVDHIAARFPGDEINLQIRRR
ncbi:hypothetical protein [Novosphingobium sp. Rr 2-17]|uniref:hypothetical protein n=1 Tax=Novosphingobium sp. Rr 2-17 TaxID=555793 RepID=UPI0012F65884|nr:hypothetical protein [Novosphingobium sp. Rr 2-17]